jgi:hypothetical protein
MSDSDHIFAICGAMSTRITLSSWLNHCRIATTPATR